MMMMMMMMMMMTHLLVSACCTWSACSLRSWLVFDNVLPIVNFTVVHVFVVKVIIIIVLP